MSGKAILRYKDYAGQSSSFEFPTVDLTNANLDATVTLIDAVVSAAADIGLGMLQTKQIIASVTDLSSASASNPAARRELKWLMTFVDLTDGHSETKEFPAVDVTNADLFVANSEDADLTASEWVSFKSAIQAVIKSNTAHSMSLTAARLVGRNL